MQDEHPAIHGEPQEANDYVADHVALLLSSLRRWTGRTLVETALPPEEQARRIFEAPFALLSHDVSPDPILNYANRSAMHLFELGWHELVVMPSRLTAETPEQAERARLLAEVCARGFIENYSGIRIAKSGRRFRIERATVWNVVDDGGRQLGQAAMFSEWRSLS